MFLLRKAGYQTRFLSLVKTKQRCAGPEALKIDLYSPIYISRCLFSVAVKDGPLPLAPFPPSCHHKRGFWPTSGTAQLAQFNPNLKDKPYSFMFFFYYDTLQFGQIVVFGCPARDNFVRTGMLEIPTWNP